MTIANRTLPKTMTLTDAAAERVRALMAAAGKEHAALRIGVKNGGCAGMEYTLEYAEAKKPHDEVVEDKGVEILIDPTAVLFLLGTEMDYKADRLRSGFVFNNPNQTGSCGCFLTRKKRLKRGPPRLDRGRVASLRRGKRRRDALDRRPAPLGDRRQRRSRA